MRIVIVGGGMVGLTLARMLHMRGQDPVVLERMPAGRYVPRPFMLGFQGFAPLEDLGVLGHVREAGWDIAPEADGDPAAICVDVGIVLSAIGEGVPVNHGESVVELLRDGERVVGVVSEGPDGRTDLPADLVVACDGIMSPVRTMAGLEAEFSPLVEASLSYLSPVVADRSFHMDYLSDGGLILLMGWPQGSSGSRSIDKVGAEAALAPGVEAFKRTFAELMPEAEESLTGVTSIDQLRYEEPRVLRCPHWSTPGVLLIGDSAHFFGPETGVGAGIGLGDAHALAEAVARHPDDADEACAAYELWRAPAVRPYEAADPAWQRMAPVGAAERPAAEIWPPA